MSVTHAQIWNELFIFQVRHFPGPVFPVLHFQSRIFQYRILVPQTSLVPHFPVPHLPVPHFQRDQVLLVSNSNLCLAAFPSYCRLFVKFSLSTAGTQSFRVYSYFQDHEIWSQETRNIALSCGIDIFTNDYFVLSQCTRLSDRQMSTAR